MAIVGRIAEIWRYPVKSMQGEALTECELSILGIHGDRGWALRDEHTGEIRGAKKLPELMQMTATYRSEPRADMIPHANIRLSSGTVLGTDDNDINEKLSDVLQKSVSLFARKPAGDLDHYRRTVPLTPDELRELLGRDPDEPLPDLSMFPPKLLAEITEFTSPPGTYFDAYPIHLLTTSWLAELRTKNTGSRFEPLRFRPNFVIDGAASGLAELAWCGKRLRIGKVELDCDIPTVRCGMTTHETSDLPKDLKVLRTIVRDTGQNVGAYATVFSTGTVRVGDPVELR
ncbi:MAG: MOSC N-terminal beta barrel domain-containing protein [Proteobacteria bacterium]|nr:MOSC N-terminal beta barrel domain-containing protein [Pseudomonadota bacterium]